MSDVCRYLYCTRCPLGSQEAHLPDLEELYHYSSSYRTIFLVKMLHFWPKVQHRSTLYDRPSLTTPKIRNFGLVHFHFFNIFFSALEKIEKTSISFEKSSKKVLTEFFLSYSCTARFYALCSHLQNLIKYAGKQ